MSAAPARSQLTRVAETLLVAGAGARAQGMARAPAPGGNVRGIAMGQPVRLFVLAVALPIAFAAFGVAGLPPPRGAPGPLAQTAVELAVLIAASSGAALAAYRL